MPEVILRIGFEDHTNTRKEIYIRDPNMVSGWAGDNEAVYIDLNSGHVIDPLLKNVPVRYIGAAMAVVQKVKLTDPGSCAVYLVYLEPDGVIRVYDAEDGPDAYKAFYSIDAESGRFTPWRPEEVTQTE